MRIAIAGASGLVGRALTTHLRDRGDDVVRLHRDLPWQPDSLDAVVDLAGAGVADHRWNAAHLRLVRESRTTTTDRCARLAAATGIPLVNASAVGYYGDRPGETLDEAAAPGRGVLADICVHWEAAAAPARDAGCRVALLRTGIVLAPHGGALTRLLPLVRAGLGGPLGPGTQVWPWITLLDEVRAITAILDGDLAGPVNLTAPTRTTQAELVRALAAAVHRPALVPTPAPALRLALGGFAGELLASQHVVPRRLLDAGLTFTHPDPAAAAAYVTQ